LPLTDEQLLVGTEERLRLGRDVGDVYVDRDELPLGVLAKARAPGFSDREMARSRRYADVKVRPGAR
jgi:hypothetical protein